MVALDCDRSAICTLLELGVSNVVSVALATCQYQLRASTFVNILAFEDSGNTSSITCITGMGCLSRLRALLSSFGSIQILRSPDRKCFERMSQKQLLAKNGLFLPNERCDLSVVFYTLFYSFT